jgi:hypothetical protein
VGTGRLSTSAIITAVTTVASSSIIGGTTLYTPYDDLVEYW